MREEKESFCIEFFVEVFKGGDDVFTRDVN